MATIFKGGTLAELDPAVVERADLRIEAGQIVARDATLAPEANDEVVDLTGRLVLPGLVCGHHHLYSSLARGMPPPAEPPQSFSDVLESIWWRLDRALDLDLCEISATVGTLEALQSGTTTLLDHHASPNAIRGSLRRVARGMNEVGLRGVLAYEVTDRNGAMGREEGLEENVEFQRQAKGRFRGLVGAHAAFTLSNDAIQGLRQAVQDTGAGLHIHLAEDPCDERLSVERFGDSPVARLMAAELFTPQSVLAHAVHLSWPDLSQVISTGAWLCHNPTSNMNNQVGYAPVGKFGARGLLGTDGLGADMFQEAQRAHFRAREAGMPIDILKYVANGHRLASQLFGLPMGPLRPGAAADLVVLDYRPPTPLAAQNLADHFLHGLSGRLVESVMVDGIWRMWARTPLSVHGDQLAETARAAAEQLWTKMAEIA